MFDPRGDLIWQRVAVALHRAAHHQLAEVGRLGVTRRNGELGQQDPAELEVDRCPLRHQQRVVACTGVLIGGEDAPHLRSRLEIELLGVEAEPVGLVAGGTGLDAEQDVVGLCLVPPRVMGVVGGEKRCPDTPGDVHEVGEDAALRFQPVVLDLDEEVVFSKDVLVVGGRRHRGIDIAHRLGYAFLPRRIGGEVLRHRATQAA